MQKYNNDPEYLNIINNILENKSFNKIEKIKHHNTNRLSHSIKVSYYSYKLSKFLKLDYVSAAIGGLLHDFYTEEISKCKKIKDRIKLFSSIHPKEAVTNSEKILNLNDKEINIIETHMFPMNYKLPKYVESWIVNLVDTFVSCKEIFTKFSYQLTYVINLYIIFILNGLK